MHSPQALGWTSTPGRPGYMVAEVTMAGMGFGFPFCWVWRLACSSGRCPRGTGPRTSLWHIGSGSLSRHCVSVLHVSPCHSTSIPIFERNTSSNIKGSRGRTFLRSLPSRHKFSHVKSPAETMKVNSVMRFGNGRALDLCWGHRNPTVRRANQSD